MKREARRLVGDRRSRTSSNALTGLGDTVSVCCSVPVNADARLLGVAGPLEPTPASVDASALSPAAATPVRTS